MTVILADINSHLNRRRQPSGHCLSVARNYLDAYGGALGITIAGGPLYAGRFPSLLQLPFDTVDGESKFLTKLKQLLNLAALFRRCPSCVILQSCAAATCYLGIFLFARRRHRVYMIQYSVSEGLDSIGKRFLYWLAKSKIRGLLCPNEMVGRAYNKPCCVLPDYAYLKKDRPEQMEKTYDFAMIGAISPEKGVVEAAVKLARERYKVLVAGVVQEGNAEIESHLREMAEMYPNLTLKLERLTDEEYNGSFQRSRYAVFNYSKTYDERSSGAVLDALYNRCPVVVHSCLAMAFVMENQLGAVFNELEDVDFKGILRGEACVSYVGNIRKYLASQDDLSEKLGKFISEQGRSS